jgi:hypothetical protein
MNIRHQGITLGMATILLGCSTAYAGEVVTKAADKITISGYSQARSAYRDDIPDSLVNSAIFVKRARVKLVANISDRTWSELQLDFASSRLVKDAMVGIDLSKALTVIAGQLKRPFSQEELFSSSATPVIDRGLTNLLSSGLLGYSGRSQGLLIRGSAGRTTKLTGELGIFTGAGEADIGAGDALLERQTDFNNRGKDWVGRLAVNTGNATKIRLAVNASSRSVGGNFTDGAMLTHTARTFTAYGGDAEVKHGALSIWGELLSGENYNGFTDTLTTFSAPTFLGWHIAAIYTTALGGSGLVTAVQPEARFENLDPNTDTADDGSSLITTGLSLFFGKNTRWRTNVEWQSFQNTTPTSTRFVSELQAKI